ncbi:hypothetical protein BKA66DRAFT_566556 [Pyrenochaeta sp. MPI-SDFR-AT-0127]|nr:hypothetical protein BKA66DRAFT_566556 [Pyrenochaeta sp. MPI-SDFR-AT-0127]
MAVVNLIVSFIILVTSLALVGLSISTFYLTGHAFKTLATHFPGDEYVWWGSGPGPLPSDPFHMVTLSYDWTTENLLWVTSAFSVLSGLVGLAVFFFSLRQARQQSTYGASTKLTSWNRLPVVALTAVTFLTTFISTIWVFVHRVDLMNSTCNWRDGQQPNNLFVCSRELVACNVGQLLVPHDYRWQPREEACRETHTSRMIMIPLAAISLVLAATHGVQIYLEKKAESERAEVRVGRLQQED